MTLCCAPELRETGVSGESLSGNLEFRFTPGTWKNGDPESPGSAGSRSRPEIRVAGVALISGFPESPRILGVTRKNGNSEFRVIQGTRSYGRLQEPGVPGDSCNAGWIREHVPGYSGNPGLFREPGVTQGTRSTRWIRETVVLGSGWLR